MYKKLGTAYCLFLCSLFANPFLIEYPAKETITYEDYIEIEKKLQEIDISPILNEWYPSSLPRKWFKPWSFSLATKEDFFHRICKAKTQKLIDLASNKLPEKALIKIGKGGDNCFVCYASFNGIYAKLIAELPKELEKAGFNGYLFYRIGGFPNPSGKEIRYCAVPYAFKVFSILEAHQLGFEKVLWIDASLLPLKDPTPLFHWLEQEGAFLKSHETFTKFILPKTVAYIKENTSVDVLHVPYISAQIIGFDFRSSKTQSFIDKYYKMVELGFPFFSCFPEEYVFSAIIGQNPQLWKPQPFRKLLFPEIKLRGRTLEWTQKEGYFFLLRNH